MAIKSLSSVERSKNLLLQVSSSFVIKLLLFFVTFAQFPVFNQFLNKDEFGMWLTFISFYTWFILFDFGIGHGLKNILTQKLSFDDHEAIKTYSASGLAGTILIAIIFILFYEFSSLNIFSSSSGSIENEALQSSLTFTFYSCIILFLHNSLSSFMHAAQKASYSNYLSLFVNSTLLLLVIFISMGVIKVSYKSPLEFLCQVNFALYVILFVIISILFFSSYPSFIPNIRRATMSGIKDVLSKGAQFFFIQVSVLIIYPIDSFILTNFVSASSAGDYNVIIKTYSIILAIGALINQSSWPSITEAFYKKDYNWLKVFFNKFIVINLLLGIGVLILTFSLNFIITIWMRETYNFSFEVITLAGALHAIILIAVALSTVLYSTNFLKSQILIGMILIPLKLILVHYLVINQKLGMKGVLISSLICFTVFGLFNLFYFIKKFKHIWGASFSLK